MQRKYFDQYDRNSRLYSVWRHMKERCNNENHMAFQRYGGRGISVCDDWSSEFLSFKSWALENGYNPDLSLDRIDNNGDYCPENCRWATRVEQQNNTSKNRLLTFNGETHSIAEWGRITGVNRRTIMSRLRAGWSIDNALTQAVKGHKN